MLTDEVPRVSTGGRLEVHEFESGLYRVVAHWGYIESPSFEEVLSLLISDGVLAGRDRISVYLGRETLIVTRRPGMARWRKHLFALVSRNAQRPTLHFGIPPGQVVELGLQVEL
jgi:KUP system potassium uptake protein